MLPKSLKSHPQDLIFGHLGRFMRIWAEDLGRNLLTLTKQTETTKTTDTDQQTMLLKVLQKLLHVLLA